MYEIKYVLFNIFLYFVKGIYDNIQFYIFPNRLYFLVFVLIAIFLISEKIITYQLTFETFAIAVCKSYALCLIYHQIELTPYRIKDLYYYISNLSPTTGTILFNTLLCIELLFLLILVTLIYERKNPNSFKKIFSEFNLKLFFSNFIYIIIAFFAYLILLPVIYSINNLKEMVDDPFINGLSFIKNGLFSSFMILLIGKLINISYLFIFKLIEKWKNGHYLRILNSNSKMWAFIVVSLIYVFLLSNENKIDSDVIYISTGIIWGKFFWIDNRNNELKKTLNSFWNLDFLSIIAYCVTINSLILICILNTIDESFCNKNLNFIPGFVIAIILFGFNIKHVITKFSQNSN